MDFFYLVDKIKDMFSKFIEEFKKFHWLQKNFFVLVVAGLIFYTLYHTGVVKMPSARARDCSEVPKAENAVVIKMENNAFDPKELTANVCDTLLFLNLDDEAKWPASGPHPHHTSYPGFDAGHPLEKYGFFQFQVTRIGNYSFHDHLHEDATGKIIIKDVPR